MRLSYQIPTKCQNDTFVRNGFAFSIGHDLLELCKTQVVTSNVLRITDFHKWKRLSHILINALSIVSDVFSKEKNISELLWFGLHTTKQQLNSCLFCKDSVISSPFLGSTNL